MAKYCPDCGDVLGNPYRCDNKACKWVDVTGAKAEKKQTDLLCAFVYMGDRCERIGSVSKNLRGGGPWYCCRSHMERDASEPPKDKPAVDWRDELINHQIDKLGLKGYAPKTLAEKQEAMSFMREVCERFNGS